MSLIAIKQQTVTKATTTGLVIDGKFTPVGRWSKLDLDALEWKCREPAWFQEAVADLRWAEECGERHVATMIDNVAILRHPYALLLRDAIDDLGADWSFDPFLNAFKITDPELYADSLREICDWYSIAPSPKFEDRLNGLEEVVEAVISTAEEALRKGFEAPSGFKSGRELKPHQVEAVLALAANGGGLLADQVGLGKGGEFICGLLAQNDWLEKRGHPHNYPAVVSVTKSMKLEIAQEITKWKHDARIVVLDTIKTSPIDPDAQFIVLNHDILSPRLPDLLDVKPRAFIVDEAHVFKNDAAARSKAALKLANAVRKNREYPYVALATGTPFLNAPHELWMPLTILGKERHFFNVARQAYLDEHGTTKMRTRVGRHRPGPHGRGKAGKIMWHDKELWPQRAFEVRWCGGKYDKFGAWWNNKATNTAELNRLLLETGMIRRRKSDVIKPLPALEESLHRFDLDADDKDRYDEIHEDFRQWLIDEVSEEARKAGRNQMRAVENALRKLMSGEDVMRLTRLRSELSLMKVPHTVEWVHKFMNGELGEGPWDRTRHKLILYVHHKEARKALLEEPSFAQYNPVSILSGDEQKETSIVEDKKRFQTDDDVRLIVCSMAAREGHTLTAAKDVYLHEMPFVPSWIVQMAGRCWARMSEEYEPHEAYLHYAIANDTIDAMLVRMNAVKKSMFEAVIDGEGQGVEDEILFGDGSGSRSKEEASARLLEAFSIGARELEIAK